MEASGKLGHTHTHNPENQKRTSTYCTKEGGPSVVGETEAYHLIELLFRLRLSFYSV